MNRPSIHRPSVLLVLIAVVAALLVPVQPAEAATDYWARNVPGQTWSAEVRCHTSSRVTASVRVAGDTRAFYTYKRDRRSRLGGPTCKWTRSVPFRGW